MSADDKRWLICGGRGFGDLRCGRASPDWAAREAERNHIVDFLERLCVERSSSYTATDNWLPDDIIVIAGGASGVDQVAAEWAMVNWCRYEEFKADWNKHGRSAGPIRNRRMLIDGRPDLVIAFTGGKGTADMVSIARKAGVETIVVPYPEAKQQVPGP